MQSWRICRFSNDISERSDVKVLSMKDNDNNHRPRRRQENTSEIFIPHILNHLHPTSSPPPPEFIRIMTDINLFSQISMLNKFSEMIRGNLTKIQRQKIVALVTIEVHARDVIEKMIKSGCGDVTAFEWLSQLRLYWDKVCKKLYDTNCFISN